MSEMTADALTHSSAPLEQISVVPLRSTAVERVAGCASTSRAAPADLCKNVFVLRDGGGAPDSSTTLESDVVDESCASADRDTSSRGDLKCVQPRDCLAWIETDKCLYAVCKPRITIGRRSPHSPADIVLEHSCISRTHLELFFDNCWRIKCNGKHGVTVNGEFLNRNVVDAVLPNDCVLGFPNTNILLNFSSRGAKCCPATEECLLTPRSVSSIHPEDPSCNSITPLYESRSKSSDASYGLFDNTPEYDSGYEQQENGDSSGEFLGVKDDSLSSSCFADDKDCKPPYSYAQLIVQAIASTEDRQMTLSGIYGFISKHYAYYRGMDKGWQNSIRHNLSLSRHFVRVPRSQDEPGKGSFWRLDPTCEAKQIELAFKKRRQGKTFCSASSSSSSSITCGDVLGSNAAAVGGGVATSPTTPWTDAPPSPVTWHLGDATAAKSSRDNNSPISADALPHTATYSKISLPLTPVTVSPTQSAKNASFFDQSTNHPVARLPLAAIVVDQRNAATATIAACDAMRDVQRRLHHDAKQSQSGESVERATSGEEDDRSRSDDASVETRQHYDLSPLAKIEKATVDARLPYARVETASSSSTPTLRFKTSDAKSEKTSDVKGVQYDESRLQYESRQCVGSQASDRRATDRLPDKSVDLVLPCSDSNTEFRSASLDTIESLGQCTTDNKTDLNSCQEKRQEVPTDTNLSYGSNSCSALCCTGSSDQKSTLSSISVKLTSDTEPLTAPVDLNAGQISNCLNNKTSLRLPLAPDSNSFGSNVVHFKDDHETHEYEVADYQCVASDSLDVPRRLHNGQQIIGACSLSPNNHENVKNSHFCHGTNSIFASRSAPPSPRPCRKHDAPNVESGTEIPDRAHHSSGGGSTFRVRRDAADGRQRLQISHSPPRYAHVTSKDASALTELALESRSRRYSAVQLPTSSLTTTSAPPLCDRPCSSASSTSAMAPSLLSYANASRNGSKSLSTTPVRELLGKNSSRFVVDAAPSIAKSSIVGASSAQTKQCIKQRIRSGTGKLCGNGFGVDPQNFGGFTTSKLYSGGGSAADLSRVATYDSVNGQSPTSAAADLFSRGGNANGQSAPGLSIDGASLLDHYAFLGQSSKLVNSNPGGFAMGSSARPVVFNRNLPQASVSMSNVGSNNLNTLFNAANFQPSLSLARAVALSNQNINSANSRSSPVGLPPPQQQQMAWPSPFDPAAVNLLLHQLQQQQQLSSVAALTALAANICGSGAGHPAAGAGHPCDNPFLAQLSFLSRLDPSMLPVFHGSIAAAAGLRGGPGADPASGPVMGAGGPSPPASAVGAAPPLDTATLLMAAGLGGGARESMAAATNLIEQSRVNAALAQLLAAHQQQQQSGGGGNKRTNSPQVQQRDFATKVARRH